MKLVVLLFYVFSFEAVVLGFSKRGSPPQCADNAIDCKGIERRRQCRDINACSHEIWSSSSATEDNIAICDICQKLMQNSPGFLHASTKTTESYTVEVATVSTTKKNHECSHCLTVILKLKKFLNSFSESKLKASLENYCNENNNACLCEFLVSSYFPKFYGYITDSAVSSFCSCVSMCPQKCKIKYQPPESNPAFICDFCGHLLSSLKKNLTKGSKLEFISTMQKVCQYMPDFVKCKTFMNKNHVLLHDFLARLEMKSMCSVMGLCTNQTDFSLPVDVWDELGSPSDVEKGSPTNYIEGHVHEEHGDNILGTMQIEVFPNIFPDSEEPDNEQVKPVEGFPDFGETVTEETKSAEEFPHILHECDESLAEEAQPTGELRNVPDFEENVSVGTMQIEVFPNIFPDSEEPDNEQAKSADEFPDFGETVTEQTKPWKEFPDIFPEFEKTATEEAKSAEESPHILPECDETPAEEALSTGELRNVLDFGESVSGMFVIAEKLKVVL